MSENYDEYDDDIDDIDDDKPERSNGEWAKLRRAEKARDKAEKELAAMKREMAFAKAGIDVSDPKASYFVKGYEGDITPEAIKAEAIKAGFLSEPTDPPADDLQEQGQIANASQGAPAEGGAGVDYAALDRAFVEGGTDGMMQYLEQVGVPINYAQ